MTQCFFDTPNVFVSEARLLNFFRAHLKYSFPNRIQKESISAYYSVWSEKMKKLLENVSVYGKIVKSI
jgi:hypothetical protein